MSEDQTAATKGEGETGQGGTETNGDKPMDEATAEESKGEGENK